MLTAFASLIIANGAFAKSHSAPVQVTVPKVEAFNKLPAGVELGIYDDSNAFGKVSTIKYEEVWFSWNKDPKTLLPALKAIVAKGRTPLLTVEPNSVAPLTTNTLLADITSGKYKAREVAVIRVIKTLGSPVLVRFAPEMECVPIRSWSTKNPADYIAAFRQFVTMLRGAALQAQVVWSPIGEGSLPKENLATLNDVPRTGYTEPCEAYYPGDAFVNYVGCSIYELPAATSKWFGHPLSFADWMTIRYSHLAQFNKPIIIAELGIYGTPEEQKEWMDAAFSSVGTFPLVKVLCYYNSMDANSWKLLNVDHPVWNINPAVFSN